MIGLGSDKNTTCQNKRMLPSHQQSASRLVQQAQWSPQSSWLICQLFDNMKLGRQALKTNLSMNLQSTYMRRECWSSTKREISGAVNYYEERGMKDWNLRKLDNVQWTLDMPTWKGHISPSQGIGSNGHVMAWPIFEYVYIEQTITWPRPRHLSS